MRKSYTNTPPWLLWMLLPLALVPLLIWLESRFDLKTSALFFNVSSASFPWREHWFTRGLLHRFGRLPAALVFLGFVVACLYQRRIGHLLRFAQMRFVCVTMLVCVVAVNLIKRSSNSACTWDLIEFGGRFPHLGWFDSLPLAMVPGHCWPGAFSLSGFALFAVYFYLYDLANYKRANVLLVVVLLYANALGFVQVMRGAHGISHQLWTGFFCWYLCLTCYWVYSRPARKI